MFLGVLYFRYNFIPFIYKIDFKGIFRAFTGISSYFQSVAGDGTAGRSAKDTLQKHQKTHQKSESLVPARESRLKVDKVDGVAKSFRVPKVAKVGKVDRVDRVAKVD